MSEQQQPGHARPDPRRQEPARPAGAEPGRTDLLDQIASAMHSAAAPSAGQRAFARAQLRKLCKQLRAQGLPVGDRLDQIAGQIPHDQQR